GRRGRQVFPAEPGLVRGEVGGVLVLEDRAQGVRAEPAGAGEDAGREDVEEAVPGRIQGGGEAARRGVEPPRELQRPTHVPAGGDGEGDLFGGGKGRGPQAAAAQLETGRRSAVGGPEGVKGDRDRGAPAGTGVRLEVDGPDGGGPRRDLVEH